MAGRLEGKVAIVTGSSSGIGEAIALMFASRGASVTLCGRDQDRLRSVMDKAVKVSGGLKNKFITVQGDLNDQTVRKQIVDQTVETFGRLNILVANAGISGLLSPILDETEASYDDIMDTNLKSVFFLIQHAIPHLEKARGNIVTISSIPSIMVLRNMTTYSMSKCAIDNLTRSLSVELGPKGIRVNTVQPGYFPTRVYKHFHDCDDINSKLAEAQNRRQPLKGRVGVVDDVAEAVTFLVSDAAGFITGELIKVDGGVNFTGPFTII